MEPYAICSMQLLPLRRVLACAGLGTTIKLGLWMAVVVNEQGRCDRGGGAEEAEEEWRGSELSQMGWWLVAVGNSYALQINYPQACSLPL